MFEICQVEQYSSLTGKKKRIFYLFLKHLALWVNFYFSHLWNTLRVHVVVSFSLNSTMRRIKVEEWCWKPLPFDLSAAMTTGSDGEYSKVACCWFCMQKCNSLLAPGKGWHADRARSLKCWEAGNLYFYKGTSLYGSSCLLLLHTLQYQ